MKIVVVGCGKIGTTLIEQLSAEEHDIVAIDNNRETVNQIVDKYDVMGIYGNGANHKIQEEAGVSSADLLIVTTSLDEFNLLCCLTAKKMGAGNTIARVRNPEYSDQLQILRDDFGLSMHINPEFATAGEIFRILRFPSAHKIETFADGKIEVVEVKISEDSPLSNLKLKDFSKMQDAKALVCAVQRGDETFIPGGDFELRSGDRISIIASPNHVERFFENLGDGPKKVRNVIIIGGSKIGYYLAKMLLSSGANVKIIDNDGKRTRLLCEELPKATVILGDGTNHELLHEEGIENVDAMVALTGIDEENVVISMYATSINVGKVVAKINRADILSLADKIGVDSTVSPNLITANMIIRYVRAMQSTMGSNVETLYKIAGGGAEVLEFLVKSAPKVTNKPFKELKTKTNTLIAGIIRGRQVIIPNGEDEIIVGDRVIVATTDFRMNDITDILA